MVGRQKRIDRKIGRDKIKIIKDMEGQFPMIFKLSNSI